MVHPSAPTRERRPLIRSLKGMLAVAFLGACRAPMPPDNYDAGPEDGGDASSLDVSSDAPPDAAVDAETDARAPDAEVEPDAADASTGSSDAADSNTDASGAADSSTDASDAAGD